MHAVDQRCLFVSNRLVKLAEKRQNFIAVDLDSDHLLAAERGLRSAFRDVLDLGFLDDEMPVRPSPAAWISVMMYEDPFPRCAG